MDLGRNVTQIFRKERQAPECLAQLVEQVVSRTIHPAAIHRGRLGRRNFPELIEPAKMIEPDVVAGPRRPAQPLHPPLITMTFHHIPSVKRIPPTLTSLAEEIWRNTGDYFGFEILVQAKQFAVHPDVGAVVIDEDGNVAQNANRALRTIPPQRLPLLVEGKLQGA